MIALLLAVVVVTGAAAQVWASPDTTSAPISAPTSAIDDDGPGLLPAVLLEPVAVPLPDRREPVGTCAPRRDVPGRLHAVFVFRPPRPVASR